MMYFLFLDESGGHCFAKFDRISRYSYFVVYLSEQMNMTID